ncbi:MAG: sugar ABC transporter permease [Anaerolineae bacterium]
MQRKLIWLLFLAPALLIYVRFMALPLFNSLALSFFQGTGLTPERFVGFENYIQLFTNPIWRDRFFNALGNTAVFFAIHMLVQNTLGLLFAVLLASGIKGHGLLRTVIFLPATLSVLIIGFLWRLILQSAVGRGQPVPESCRPRSVCLALAGGSHLGADRCLPGVGLAVGGPAHHVLPGGTADHF